MLSFSTIGWIHTVFGLLSLLNGTAVILLPKSNKLGHRFWGYFYFFCMVATNVTSLAMYQLNGRFNMFHWFALFSLLTLILGMLPLFRSRINNPFWLPRHAHFMAGSYVGVVLATAAEITSRVPGWEFGTAVGLTTAVGGIIGFVLIARYTPQAIANLNPRRRLAASGD
jgi:uncharacterized membrane protein